jgi:predicted nucleotidyltransferase
MVQTRPKSVTYVLISTKDNLIKPFILIGGDIVEKILKRTMTSLKGDVDVNFLRIKNVKNYFHERM